MKFGNRIDGALPPNRQRNGRIQVRIRRHLIIADRAVSTTELLRELYPGPRKGWHYTEVHSAARKFCTAAGRSSRGSGRPILWNGGAGLRSGRRCERC
jgi:hypothetical protein